MAIDSRINLQLEEPVENQESREDFTNQLNPERQNSFKITREKDFGLKEIIEKAVDEVGRFLKSLLETKNITIICVIIGILEILYPPTLVLLWSFHVATGPTQDEIDRHFFTSHILWNLFSNCATLQILDAATRLLRGAILGKRGPIRSHCWGILLFIFFKIIQALILLIEFWFVNSSKIDLETLISAWCWILGPIILFICPILASYALYIRLPPTPQASLCSCFCPHLNLFKCLKNYICPSGVGLGTLEAVHLPLWFYSFCGEIYNQFEKRTTQVARDAAHKLFGSTGMENGRPDSERIYLRLTTSSYSVIFMGTIFMLLAGGLLVAYGSRDGKKKYFLINNWLLVGVILMEMTQGVIVAIDLREETPSSGTEWKYLGLHLWGILIPFLTNIYYFICSIRAYYSLAGGQTGKATPHGAKIHAKISD